MGKQFWNFVSYLFHPALMPTLGTIIVLSCDPSIFIQSQNDIEQLIKLLAAIFLCTYILPILMSIILRKIERVSSISDPSENDRRIMLSFTCLFFLLAFYCIHDIGTEGKSLWLFMLGINISIVSTLIISLFTKVSFHSVGVGGLLGTVIGLMRYTHSEIYSWLLGAFTIVILVGLARYKLKAHDAFNIYVGLIIGIATQALVFFFATNSLS